MSYIYAPRSALALEELSEREDRIVHGVVGRGSQILADLYTDCEGCCSANPDRLGMEVREFWGPDWRVHAHIRETKTTKERR